MKRIFNKITVLLVITFALSSFSNLIPSICNLSVKEALAAETEARLDKTELKTGVGSSPAYINIENSSDSAIYRYTSADTKIATVDDDGNVFGISRGKTKISVVESIDGNNKNLGSVTVSVVKPEFADKVFYVGLRSDNYLNINYMNNSADYSYKSADPGIARVAEYGRVTGVKYGKTSITVTETCNEKTVKLGTIPVYVVQAKLNGKVKEIPISDETSDSVSIDYMNSDAVYKYHSSDTHIVKVKEDGSITGIKEGTAKVSVTETYQKKTRKLGTVTVKVVPSAISAREITIGIHSSNNLTDVIDMKNINWNAQYTCKAADSKIISAGYEKDLYGNKNYRIKGIALGETTLTVYEDYQGVRRTVGTIQVRVKEIPVAMFEFLTDYFDVQNGVLSKTFYMDTNYSYASIRDLISVKPYNTTNRIVYSSSDEKVIKIDNYNMLPRSARARLRSLQSAANIQYR